MYENLRCEVRDRIAFVTIDRPKVLNALNRATLMELEAAFRSIRDDAAVGVAILTGAGERSFVAGADINEIPAGSAAAGREFARLGQQVFALVETLGKPVIAAVNGYALGGGAELALACTLRIAAESAVFGQPEVRLGLIPGYGGSQRLPRLVGQGRALEILLTGESIKAAEAHRIGLVNRVVRAEELMAESVAMAEKILRNAPLAVAFCLEAVQRGRDAGLEEGLRIEADLFGLSTSTADMKEGARAFLEKRAPRFKGE